MAPPDYASGSGGTTLRFIAPPREPASIATFDLPGGALVATEAGATLRLADLSLL